MGRGPVNQGPKGSTVSARRGGCGQKKKLLHLFCIWRSFPSRDRSSRTAKCLVTSCDAASEEPRRCENDVFPSQKDRDCTFYAGNAVFAPPRYEMPRQSIRTERGTDAKGSVRRQRGGAYGPDCFSARTNRTSGIRSARTDDGWGRFARRRRLARMPCRLLSPYAQPRPE